MAGKKRFFDMTAHTEATDDIEVILASLTKAEKAFLASDGYTPADDGARDKPGIARQLHDRGLTFIDFSPLGYCLRTRILEDQK